MRILDLDLDFFLDRIPNGVSREKDKSGIRLDDDHYHPWDGKKFVIS